MNSVHPGFRKKALPIFILGFLIFEKIGVAEISSENRLEEVQVASVMPVTSTQMTSQVHADLDESPDDEAIGESTGFSAMLSSILYGPSLGNPSRFQPRGDGSHNYRKPLEARNYLGLSYYFNPDIAVTPTLHWSMKPVQGQEATLEDPSIKVSFANVVTQGVFSWFFDVRVIPPLSSLSRENDVKVGLQSFHVATFNFPESPFTLNFNTSARYTSFGSHGFGYDVELYAGPNVSYSLSSKVALTMLYEMSASHQFGKDFGLDNDGTDLEPGVFWQVTPQLNLSPYLHFLTGESISLKSTSVGALVNYQIF